MNSPRLIQNKTLIATVIVVGWGFFVPFFGVRAQPAPQADTKICPETCILRSSCESDLYRSGYTGTAFQPDASCETACGAGYGACYGTLQNYPLTIKLGNYAVVNEGGASDGLADYISRLYIYLLSISGVVAGIIIMYAGFKWMSAGGNSEAVSDAKTKISNALIGIALLLASYLLLQTINPQLTQLKMPPLKILRKVEQYTGQCKPSVPQQSTKMNEKYYCGKKVSCSDPEQPCAGAREGECVGSVCNSPSETCSPVDITRLSTTAKQAGLNFETTLRDSTAVCVAVTRCGSKCEDVKINNAGDEYGLALCVSTACSEHYYGKGTQARCLVESPDRGSTYTCSSPKKEGDTCEDDNDCASGICNKAWLNTCTPVGGSPNGTSCERDTDCASRLCDTIKLNECIAKNSLEYADDCVVGSTNMCKAGLFCVDTDGFDGQCSDGREGAACNRDAECGTGLSCRFPLGELGKIIPGQGYCRK